MELTPDDIKQFRDALVSAFPGKSDLGQMVFFGLGVKLNTIVDDAPLGKMALGLVDWAVAEGKEDELLKAARDANPGNPTLKAFAAKMANRAEEGPMANRAEEGPIRPPGYPHDKFAPGGDWPSQKRDPNAPNGRLDDPSLPLVIPPMPPVLPASNKLSYNDQERLRSILQRVFTFKLPEVMSRVTFLGNTQFSETWIGGFSWTADPGTVAGMLIQGAIQGGSPLQGGQVGYSILGSVLDQILRQELVGQNDGQFLASMIVRYSLINLTKPGVNLSPLLRALMQYVPQASTQAEGAVRSREGANAFLDAEWLDQGAAMCRAVCRVEASEWGTGFLVAPDLVLTNYHVVAGVIDGQWPLNQVQVRFGFKRVGNVVENGVAYDMAPAWLADSNPNQPGSLDYALLRLNQPASTELVNGQERGYLQPTPHRFQAGEDLYIIQHPRFKQRGQPTEPLKVVLAPNSVDGENADRTRVTYATNTEEGSSGSPCFTRNWELVGLHHAFIATTNRNEGIPLDTIWGQQGVKNALGLQ